MWSSRSLLRVIRLKTGYFVFPATSVCKGKVFLFIDELSINSDGETVTRDKSKIKGR